MKVVERNETQLELLIPAVFGCYFFLWLCIALKCRPVLMRKATLIFWIYNGCFCQQSCVRPFHVVCLSCICIFELIGWQPLLTCMLHKLCIFSTCLEPLTCEYASCFRTLRSCCVCVCVCVCVFGSC